MIKLNCQRNGCSRIRSEFSLFLNRRYPPRYEGKLFCSESCLLTHIEDELTGKWQRLQQVKWQRIPRPKLGTILMQTTLITREQLNEAIRLQKQTQEGRLGEWLLRLGFVEEHQITEALSRQYGLPLIKLKESDANTDAVRMIPGKVAKSSSLLPVGFAGDQDTLRIAVSGPINFISQEAIRRMVQKGIVTYIGDQSIIQRLLESWYKPEDLDLLSVPTFTNLGDLIEVGKDMVSTAIKQRADNIQAELLEDFFWVRLDFVEKLHHHFFRRVSNAFESKQTAQAGDLEVALTGSY